MFSVKGKRPFYRDGISGSRRATVKTRMTHAQTHTCTKIQAWVTARKDPRPTPSGGRFTTHVEAESSRHFTQRKEEDIMSPWRCITMVQKLGAIHFRTLSPLLHSPIAPLNPSSGWCQVSQRHREGYRGQTTVMCPAVTVLFVCFFMYVVK